LKVSAATRSRRSAPKKKPINPLLILGPIIVVLVVIVVIVASGGGDNGEGDDSSTTTTAKTQEQIQREEEEKKAAEERERKLAKLELEESYRKQADQCKTAEQLASLGLKAKNDKLHTMADNLFNKALKLEPDNARAHYGLGHRKFDCTRMLDGFEELDFLNTGDGLDEYKALDGQWVDPVTMEQTLARWEKEKSALKESAEEKENDPFEQKVTFYERQMKHKPFFGDIARANAYTIGRGPRPVALFIQEARDRQEGHGEQIERGYTPFLQSFQKHVEQNFFSKFGFKKNDGFDAYIVWILNSGGAYVNHARDFGKTSGLSVSSRAHYNFQKKVAITYLETREGLTPHEMQPLAHEMAHYFQDAYAPYGIRGISSFWVVEGMAEWISTFSGKLPDGPYFFESRNEHRTMEFLRRIKELDGVWPVPMVSILDCGNQGELRAAIQVAMSEEPQMKKHGVDTYISWFYGAGYCLCRYLNAEKEKQFISYLKKDFEGDGGLDVFQEITGIKNLSAFEKELVEYFSN